MARPRMIRDPLDTGQGVDTLPPQGDARRDVLRQRTDELEQAAETMAPELERIDPRAFRVENELAQHFNELEVKDADPAYTYCWVQSGFYGRFVNWKLAQGWEVVQGNDPEAASLRGIGADTTRRLGDTILMRCRHDIAMRQQRRDEAHRRSVLSSPEAEMQELADRAARLGVRLVRTDQMDSQTIDRLARASHAQAMAGQMTDQWMRDGNMPGAPAARR